VDDSQTRPMIWNGLMETVRIEFEPFINEGTRLFIVNGVDNYNIAVTSLSDYVPVNFVLRGERGDVLGGVLGQLWGGWLQVTYLWVAEAARGTGHRTRKAADAARRGIRSFSGRSWGDCRHTQLPGPAIL